MSAGIRTGIIALVFVSPCAIGLQAARAETPGDVAAAAAFHQHLAPHGSWHLDAGHGWVWKPEGVGVGWKPYTHGQWVFSEQHGCLWVSDWAWGWAPFHYGRWQWADRHGWVWVPGTKWGPAWVAWRRGGDYVGWAPLPASAGWNDDAGLSLAPAEIDARVATWWWSYVNVRQSGLEPLFVVLPDAPALLRATENVTVYAVGADGVVNRSLDAAEIGRESGRLMRKLEVVAVPSEALVPAACSTADRVYVQQPVLDGDEDFVRREIELMEGAAEAAAEREAEVAAERETGWQRVVKPRPSEPPWTYHPHDQTYHPTQPRYYERKPPKYYERKPPKYYQPKPPKRYKPKQWRTWE